MLSIVEQENLARAKLFLMWRGLQAGAYRVP
ncbi:hypothetical protein ABIC03_005062 [Bradyrhizobium sp. RT6a]